MRRDRQTGSSRSGVHATGASGSATRPRGGRRTRRQQRGSAVPFAVACLGLLLLVAAALGVVTAMVADHRRAQAAADLAALAGAQEAARGGDGCAAAARIASDNGADLSACVAAGADLRVTVVVAGPRWLGAHADLAAEARAGPG